MSLDEADHSLFHPLLHCQPVWYLHHHHCICLTSHLLQLLKKVVSYFLELLSLVVEVVEFFAFKVFSFELLVTVNIPNTAVVLFARGAEPDER